MPTKTAMIAGRIRREHEAKKDSELAALRAERDNLKHTAAVAMETNALLHREAAALCARVAELEAANTGLATEAQRLKAGLRFYARGLHFSPGDAICWDDVSGEPPNFLCDEYGTTIEDGTIAKDVLLGRDGAWPGEDWPPDELPEEIGLSGNKTELPK